MADKYVKLDDIIETLEHEWGYEGMREDLYNLPTADVVEVVRCKDCKHGEVSVMSKTKDGEEEILCYCNAKNKVSDVEYYCACGERRDT